MFERSIQVIAITLLSAAAALPQPAAVVLTGATVIDGNGGPPLADAVMVITGSRITAAGPRASVRIPPGAQVVDAAGRYILPGFIDTNVHLSLYGGMKDRYESLVRYHPRQNEIVLEAAQIDLKHGITTVRDSYGMLIPLTQVRDGSRAARPSARAFWRRAISWAGAGRTPSLSA